MRTGSEAAGTTRGGRRSGVHLGTLTVTTSESSKMIDINEERL
ncbi:MULTISPECIES: hypothetical protein [Parafrankia]|nr:hypothetical protein [Parafrankia soli]